MMPTDLPADVAALSDAFFDGLLDPAHPEMAANHIAVVVAHPDDETIGCGALLGRLKGASVVMVTDGAPRKLDHASTYGFASVADYAAARRAELGRALAIADMPEDALVHLGVPDQEAALNLVHLVHRLVAICEQRGIAILLTHAYEGGHPDHDATAFAVHAAAKLLSRRRQMLVVEMPFYRSNTVATIYQQFRPDRMKLQIAIPLTRAEKERKQRMFDAHRSQAAILRPFHLDAERFRLAPGYDFTELPNDGRLLYEQHDWGMTGERWRELVSAAVAELELGKRP